VRRDRATLGKSGKQNPVVRNTALVFALDQTNKEIATFANPRLVNRATALQCQDVVPRTHLHAAINRYGTHRCMRKYEAQIQLSRELQLRHDRLEVMTISAKAVQPDDTAIGIRTLCHFDGFR
jgi:hypothetical protein